MTQEPNIPRSLVDIGTHFECEWDARVTTFHNDDAVLARRVSIRCTEHDRELASAEVDRSGELPSKAQLDEIVLLEVARRALVESAPVMMQKLSAEQTTAAARQLLADRDQEWGDSEAEPA